MNPLELMAAKEAPLGSQMPNEFLSEFNIKFVERVIRFEQNDYI